MGSILNALRGISFFCAMAVCKAIADTLAHHFDTSVFRSLNRKFWDPGTSTDSAYIIPGTKYKLDAWHLSWSAAIVLIILAMFFYEPITPTGFWFKVLELFIYGGIYNGVFNTFYNHFLKYDLWQPLLKRIKL